MNARVCSFCLILISTCLPTTAQLPVHHAPPPPGIYETSVREAVKSNASWTLAESRNFELGPMTSDGKRLLAVRKDTNTIYAFDSQNKTWTSISSATWVMGLAYAKGKLWAATQTATFVTIASTDIAIIPHDNLWACDLALGNVSLVPGAKANGSDDLYRCWKQVGSAEEAVAMTSDGENLWYADSGGRLWVREATEGTKIPWKQVDSGQDITAMTFGGGTLWATNTANQLLVREPVLGRVGWKVVGDASRVTGLAYLDGKLWNLANAVKSVYTDLNGKGCGPVQTKSEISAEWTCSGIEGYKLLVQSDDDRDSVTIITPDGQPHPLNFSKTISKGAFATLGKRAEWRVINRNGKDVPIALIVRVDVQGIAGKKKQKSYLAVAKISEQGICVTGSVDRLEDARGIADSSANKPCL